MLVFYFWNRKVFSSLLLASICLIKVHAYTWFGVVIKLWYSKRRDHVLRQRDLVVGISCSEIELDGQGWRTHHGVEGWDHGTECAGQLDVIFFLRPFATCNMRSSRRAWRVGIERPWLWPAGLSVCWVFACHCSRFPDCSGYFFLASSF